MRIKDKISFSKEELIKHGPITIVAFGDSVTHGALADGEMDYDSVYHRRLARKISSARAYIPVNVVNAGIGGITAKRSLDRMDSQVLSHSPDLCIVAFGLNDVNGPLEEYLSSLKTIFERLIARDIETVFMTPNMLNTYVASDTAEKHLEYAKKTADFQNSGRMDTYIGQARELALSMGVKVADCYSKWRELSATRDTTMLLANRINHPVREMHELFANEIFNAIFDGEIKCDSSSDSTMYS